ncbi:MAG: tetratricopeptide repeat protein [Negativicutes bacterium]
MFPSYENLSFIADKLGVSMSYLIDDDKHSSNSSTDTDLINSLLKEWLVSVNNNEQGNFDETITRLSFIKSKMIEHNLDLYSFICDFYLGKTYYEIDDFTQCESTINRILPKLEQHNLHVYLAESYFLLGKCKTSSFNCGEAVEYYERCLDVINTQKLVLKDVHVRCLINLASSLDTMNLVTKAFSVFNTALSTAREHSVSKYIGTVLNNIGYTLLKLGDLDEAKAYLSDAFVFSKIIGQTGSMAHAEGNIGLIEVKQGNYEFGIAKIKHSTEIIETFNMPIKTATAYYYLADAYFVSNNIVDAFDYCKKALRLSKKSNLPIASANGNLIFGKILKANKRKHWALKAFIAAEEIYLQHSAFENLPDLYSNLAELYFDLGRVDDGKDCYRKSVDMLSNPSKYISNQNK